MNAPRLAARMRKVMWSRNIKLALIKAKIKSDKKLKYLDN